jgi:hypothetical protein
MSAAAIGRLSGYWDRCSCPKRPSRGPEDGMQRTRGLARREADCFDLSVDHDRAVSTPAKKIFVRVPLNGRTAASTLSNRCIAKPMIHYVASDHSRRLYCFRTTSNRAAARGLKQNGGLKCTRLALPEGGLRLVQGREPRVSGQIAAREDCERIYGRRDHVAIGDLDNGFASAFSSAT